MSVVAFGSNGGRMRLVERIARAIAEAEEAARIEEREACLRDIAEAHVGPFESEREVFTATIRARAMNGVTVITSDNPHASVAAQDIAHGHGACDAASTRLAGLSIREALSHPRFLSGELWARSVLWRGLGRAWRVASPMGSSVAMLMYGADETPMEPWERTRYTSDWELVKRVVVVAESDARGCTDDRCAIHGSGTMREGSRCPTGDAAKGGTPTT